MPNGGVILSDVENIWAEEVIIPAGSNLAAVVNTQGRALIGIVMPAAWTAAALGYDVSLDNVTFNTAYDNGGNFNQSTVQAASFISIPLTNAIFAPFIRLKSVDTANAAVTQAAARILLLVFRRYLGGM